MFIAFEGIDGVGKTTQIELLRRVLAASGCRVLVTREPGGTRIGEAIRAMLLDPAYREMTRETEALLYVAARAQFVSEVVRPALEAGQIVLSDRYTDSTLAYQGYGRGLDLTRLRQMNHLATGGLQPVLTVLLDLPVDAALTRCAGHEADRLEQETQEFYQRVRQGYLELAAAEPDRYLVLSADGTPSEVAAAIRERVEVISNPVK